MGRPKAMGLSSTQGTGSAEAPLGYRCAWVPVEEGEVSDSLSASQKLGHPVSSHRTGCCGRREPEEMPRPWARKLRWEWPGGHNNVIDLLGHELEFIKC